MKNTRL